MGDEKLWCILRTSGGRTLPLARSLAEAGFEVWSPRKTVERRLPAERRARQRAAQRPTREEAITPSFVFARADRVADLMLILSLPMSPHPGFHIFRHAGRVPLVAEREIAHLRTVEERARRAIRKSRFYAVPVGQKVRPTEGAFAGLDGVVEEVEGKFARVSFRGFQVKIASWLLEPDEIENEQSTRRQDRQRVAAFG